MNDQMPEEILRDKTQSHIIKGSDGHHRRRHRSVRKRNDHRITKRPRSNNIIHVTIHLPLDNKIKNQYENFSTISSQLDKFQNRTINNDGNKNKLKNRDDHTRQVREKTLSRYPSMISKVTPHQETVIDDHNDTIISKESQSDQFGCTDQSVKIFNQNPKKKSFLSRYVKRSRCCIISSVLVALLIAVLVTGGLLAFFLTNKTIITSTTITTTTVTTTTTTTVTTTRTTTTAAICTVSPNTWYETSASMPPQCSNYTLNTDATRNVAFTNASNYCDGLSPFGTQPAWFRFQSPAGTMIVNYSMPAARCGTAGSGWYAGQYPSTVYTTATSIGCYIGGANPCFWCNLVSITNCNSFFVFYLPKPPTCNLRYCTI